MRHVGLSASAELLVNLVKLEFSDFLFLII